LTRDAKTITTCSGETLMRLLRHLLLSTAVLFFLAQATVAREWTDASGKFKVEAELVKVEGGKVFLKKQVDGATIQVPVNLLSAADQAHLQSLQSPTAELAAAGSQPAFRLGTVGCVGLLVVDPKPLLQHETLGQQPLKGLVDKAVDQAGIDFRKVERVTVFLLKPELEGDSQQSNAVAVAEFSGTVDAAPMLAKIPTLYEAVTVAEKLCHKPAKASSPWVSVIDEKTLAIAPDEKSLTSVLTATGDDADLTKLLAGADAKNEIRYVLNMAPMKDLLVQVRTALPPDAADGAKALEVVEKIDSMVLTTDLDGPPSIELLIQAGEGVSVADLEKEIRNGLAKLPELAKAGMETGMQAAAKQESAPAMPMNPAMMAQMLAGMGEKIDEALNFEPLEHALKISVKFPPNSPPLTQTIAQIGSFMAMMSQQSPPGGPVATPPK